MDTIDSITNDKLIQYGHAILGQNEYNEISKAYVQCKNIVQIYVVKNGFIEDNRVLMEDPFRTVGGIIDLFENHVEERNKLIMTINEIKRNALEIS